MIKDIHFYFNENPVDLVIMIILLRGLYSFLAAFIKQYSKLIKQNE